MLNPGALIQQLPTPIAISWLRCHNSRGRPDFLPALIHLARVTVGVIHGLVLGLGRTVRDRGGPDVPACLDRQFQWGGAETLCRDLEIIRPRCPPSWLPEARDAESFDFVAALAGSRPAPSLSGFLEVLEWLGSLEAPDPRRGGTEPAALSAPLRREETEAAVWAFVEQLATDYLAFLARWRFVVAPGHDRNRSWETGTGIEFRGPLPGCVAELAAALDRGQVFALPEGGSPVALYPWCLFGSPLLKGIVGTGETFWKLPEEMLVLDACAAGGLLFRSGATGVVVSRNDLLADVRAALEIHSIQPFPRWRTTAWGYVAVNLDQSRHLIERLGYEAVDEVIKELDRAAAEFVPDQREPFGNPKLFPFWRQSDLLLMPLMYDAERHPPHALLSLVMTAVTGILAPAVRALKTGHEDLKFNVIMDVRIWDESRTKRTLEKAVLCGVEEARKVLKDLRQTTDQRSPILWMRREAESGSWCHCAEPHFTRVSTAAFGLILRPAGAGFEFLLGWNQRHGGFNFPGGHLELIDGGNPRLALARELREELGWTVPPATLRAVLETPLREVRRSEPRNEETCYVHHFYLVEGSPAPGRSGRPGTAESQWVSVEELQRGITRDGRLVCRFPFESVQSVTLPLAAGPVALPLPGCGPDWPANQPARSSS